MNKKNVLYLGWCMPYDNVAHAGGQVFNYYIKKMAEKANVKLITIALDGEKEKRTIEKYGVDARYVEFNNVSIFGKLISINSRVNPWHKYGNLVTKYKAKSIILEVKKLKKEGYNPDVVVLQWTQMILLIDEVKKVFPDARYVAAEEDVTFLRLQREIMNVNGLFRLYRKIRFKNEKNKELEALNKFDLVFTNNEKDYNLLCKNEIRHDLLRILVPYFHLYNNSRKNINNDIMFYGNMGRPENYNAAIWFINKIMPKIESSMVRFVIVGGNSDVLKKYSSEKVVLTGYVDDPASFFSSSALFVAPIQNGAGIKIKVLEALSSGIPVITTDVGIEGIPAERGKEYLHYNNADELVEIINNAFINYDIVKEIGNKGRQFVNRMFNYEDSVRKYIDEILSM